MAENPFKSSDPKKGEECPVRIAERKTTVSETFRLLECSVLMEKDHDKTVCGVAAGL